MGNITDIINRLRRSGERGASGVEYGLIVALLLTGSTATFEMMDDRVSEHYDDTASDIGQADLAYFDVTTTTCSPCSTTTVATTTVPATTAPPTTAAPTTTAAPSDPPAEIGFQNKTSERRDGWRARVKITLDDDNGDKLRRTDFQITWVTANGDTRVRKYTTNNGGNKTPSWSGLDRDDFPVKITIDWIDDDGEPYTPTPATYTINR
ncbi:MAG: hypothetical protein RIB98_16015 [Acidimicrobiales bacterium]